MSRNEITLQEMFSSVIRELRGRRQVGDSTHLPVSGECILGIHQMATNAHMTEPDRAEEIERLPQTEELWLEVRCPPISKRYVRFTTGQVDRKMVAIYPRLVWACVYRHIGQIGKRRSSFQHRLLGTGRQRWACRHDPPNTRQKTKKFSLYLMFYAKRDSFVDLAYLHKRDLQGNTLSYRRWEDRTALTRVIGRLCKWWEWLANKGQDSLFIPYYHKVRKARKQHTGNTRRRSGHSTNV